MKKILLVLLLVAIASSASVSYMCSTGFYTEELACYPTSSATDNCKTLSDPYTCSECVHSLFQLENGYCDYDDDEKYDNVKVVESFRSSKTEINKLNTLKRAYYKWLYTSKFDLNKVSCYKDGNLIPEECAYKHYFDETAFKCIECDTNSICNQCSLSGTTVVCSECATGYFLDENGVCSTSKCDENAITCSAADKAATCEAGYFLDNGACTACPDNSLCSAKDTVASCIQGAYLVVSEDDGSKSCSLCNNGSNNVRQCTGALEDGKSTNITECDAPSSTKTYFLTTEGCVEVTRSYNCKTVTKNADTSEYECSTCFTSTHELLGGRCVNKCASNYYLDKNSTATGTYRTCRSCGNPCTSCTQTVTDGVSTVTCNSYDDTICANEDYYDPIYALKITYSDDTDGTFSTLDKKECKVHVSSANGDTDSDNYYGCQEYGVNDYSSPQYTCTKCIDGYAFKKVFTDSTYGTSVPKSWRCIDPDTTASNASKYCKTFKTDGTNYECEECFTTVSGTYVASITVDGKLTCDAVVEDKGPYRAAIVDCLRYKKGADGKYECEICDSGKVLQTTYTGTGTSWGIIDTSKPVVCVDEETTGDAAYCDHIDVSSDDSTPLKRCTAASTTECSTSKQLKMTAQSDGTTVYTCEASASAPAAGANCKKVNVDTSGNESCVSITAYSAADTCITGSGTIVYEDNSGTKELKYCKAVETTTTNLDYNCTVVLDDGSQNYTCLEQTTCANDKAKVIIYGANDATTIVRTADKSYVCADTDTSYCLTIEASGDYFKVANTNYELGQATAEVCEENTECTDYDTYMRVKKDDSTDGSFSGNWVSTTCIAIAEAKCKYSLEDTTASTTLKKCELVDVDKQECRDSTNKVLLITYASSFGSTVEGYSCEAVNTTTSDADYDCTITEQVTSSGAVRCASNTACATAANLPATIYDGSDSTYTGNETTICETKDTDLTKLDFSSAKGQSRGSEDTECNSGAVKLKYGSSSGFTDFSAATCETLSSVTTSNAYKCLKYRENSASTPVIECLLQDGTATCDETTEIPYTGYDFASVDSANVKCVTTATSYTADPLNLCLVATTTSATATTDEVNICSSCLQYNYLTSNRCYETAITGCEEYATQSTCSKCLADADGLASGTYVLAADKTCKSCSSVANCATYVYDTTNDNCKCSLCKNGFYVDNDACVNTAIPNCLVLSTEMTATKDCYMCDLGYKWNSTTLACEACDGTTIVCVQTGCKSLYTSSSSSSSGSNSNILMFVLSALLTLVTLLI